MNLQLFYSPPSITTNSNIEDKMSQWIAVVNEKARQNTKDVINTLSVYFYNDNQH